MQDILDLIANAKLGERRGAAHELTLDDLSPSAPREVSCVQRLRHSHHLLARALAEGKAPISAAAISGYAPSTVYALRVDPAFQELVAHYTAQVEDIFASVQDRIGALGVSFLDELQHRLEIAPETFSNEQLRKLAESMLDRSVAPSKGQKADARLGPSAISLSISFSKPGPQAQPVLDLTAA